MKRQAVAAATLAVIMAGAGVAGGGLQGARASAAPQVSVTSATAPAGGQVTVMIEGDSGDATFGAFTIDLAYDPSAVKATACSTHAGLCNANSTARTARVAGVFFPGAHGHVEFGRVTFHILGNAGSSTALDVHVVELVDGQALDIRQRTEVHDGTITVSGRSQRMGDANCDGDIDAVDGLAILREVSGQAEAPCRAAADVDCDGALDAVDALLVLRFVAGLPVHSNAGCPAIGESS